MVSKLVFYAQLTGSYIRAMYTDGEETKDQSGQNWNVTNSYN